MIQAFDKMFRGFVMRSEKKGMPSKFWNIQFDDFLNSVQFSVRSGLSALLSLVIHFKTTNLKG